MSTRDEQNARYVGFYCCDCGQVRYSAGRPRCGDCHREYAVPFEPEAKRRAEAID